jgi:phosphatidate phosphatase APP1
MLMDRACLTASTAEMCAYWIMADVTDQIFDAVELKYVVIAKVMAPFWFVSMPALM